MTEDGNKESLIDYLYGLRNRGSSFGIERMEKIVPLLGNPHQKFPIIHVAGTNGKGSTCAMLDAIYRENGYRVGLFSSPHLVHLGERIKVNGQSMNMKEIEEYTLRIRPFAEKIEIESPGMGPTFFEFMTLMAFMVFEEKQVDLAIIETGLGGRLDSTNVVRPLLSIITTIARDHCAILGETLEEIASEKAGIIKKGIPVLTGWLPENANQVIAEFAKAKESQFESMALLENIELPRTNLVGAHQRRNAALASRAVGILENEFNFQEKKNEKALMNVRLEARWQKVKSTVPMIIDACHNEEGAQALRGNLQSYQKRVVVWMGALGLDRAKEVMEVVLPYAKTIRLFQPEQPRACTIEELISLIPDSFSGSIERGGLDRFDVHFEEDDIGLEILVTGSIYLCGEVLCHVKNLRNLLDTRMQDLV